MSNHLPYLSSLECCKAQFSALYCFLISLGGTISLSADDIALYRSILSEADYCILQVDVDAIVN